MLWKTKDCRNVDIDSMSTEHIQNAMAMLERTTMLPASSGYIAKKEVRATGTSSGAIVMTMKLMPTQEVVDQYKEMRRVLAQRVLDEHHRSEIQIANSNKVVNPFEYL